MKKKQFVALALAGVLGLAGCSSTPAATPTDAPKPTEGTERTTEEITTDIVIVGAGGAGLSAALTAVQEGSEVVLLEKQAFVGGATMLAGGGTNATGSQVNKDAGVEDTAADLKADMLKNGHNLNDEATLDIYVNTVGAAFDWLIDPEGGAVEYDLSEPGRTYSAVGRGAQVIKTLNERFLAAGGTELLETPGKELIVEDGKVTGVKASGPDKDYIIHAKAVIFSTGGYGNNPDLVPEKYQKFLYAGAAGATGDALAMAEAVNADTIHMEYVNVQPNTIKMPSGMGHYANPGVGSAYATSGAFLVNNEGTRFVNEQTNAFDIKEAMTDNDNTYLILDQASFDAFNKGMTGSAIYTEDQVKEWLASNGTSNPLMIQADSLEALASALKLPEGSLDAAAEKYNAGAAADTDEFGRKSPKALSAEGPYYAIEMFNRYYATLGGLHINDQMQVLSADQQPIVGLYAAGEVVGGLEGDIYYGGSLFGWAMTSGHNAGLTASAFAAGK